MNGYPTCKETKYTCNDGVLTKVKAVCTTPPVTTKSFECQTIDLNAGCAGTVTCAQGQRIVGIRAACNLEQGRVPTAYINALALNQLSVQRASDRLEDGRCQLDAVVIQSGNASAARSLNAQSLNFGCQEYDKNGGDCHIAGQILCQ